jgi:uncharacterized Ntn-hydrolase superfamily protein
MTFSLVGRCERTGMMGVAITTSSIAVGARCPHARAGAGAVSSQNVTDPRLGDAVLDELQRGHAAEEALRRVIADAPHAEYRQLLVVDAAGRTACHSGTSSLGIHTEKIGNQCVAAGNLLADTATIDAMVEAFEAEGASVLPDRLLSALEAGLRAGGEAGPVHSAALLVVHRHAFPLVDLRVDWAEDDPVGTLRRLWTSYEPQMDDYVTRADNPAGAPSYGVPGDE